MVVLTNPPTEQLSLVDAYKPIANARVAGIVPVVDLSSPNSAADIVRACEELGFFKVTNHGFPSDLTARLETEALRFFSAGEDEKEKGGPALPFGYGNKRIGYNGDMGWVEYLLFEITSQPLPPASLDFLDEPSATRFRVALNEYITAVKRLACELLELMAEGMGIQPRDCFSKMVMQEESDRMFRLNHYPPRPQQQLNSSLSLTGFGEHTDPQIISVLRSNNSSGFQIAVRDGSWVPVPPDQDSFFINVGDILQVMTNGRFRSVRHRVESNGCEPRLSMIYFGGPPPSQVVGPLPQLLLRSGDRSRYKEFTWADYKKAAYNSKLADNRLSPFENTVA
ncbi:gibberellin 2-beta-dioxygenase-like [Iris pallida]|uniref:gibberellin 2beta-dioxygenase n=1 Tax=Iris pallida TaxID=29817 RepID=A0AAX6GCM8_IRIPA|nr:gibberellin 2-beta-dioxygenase-like [Iris pallida]